MTQQTLAQSIAELRDRLAIIETQDISEKSLLARGLKSLIGGADHAHLPAVSGGGVKKPPSLPSKVATDFPEPNKLPVPHTSSGEFMGKDAKGGLPAKQGHTYDGDYTTANTPAKYSADSEFIGKDVKGGLPAKQGHTYDGDYTTANTPAKYSPNGELIGKDVKGGLPASQGHTYDGELGKGGLPARQGIATADGELAKSGALSTIRKGPNGEWQAQAPNGEWRSVDGELLDREFKSATSSAQRSGHTIDGEFSRVPHGGGGAKPPNGAGRAAAGGAAAGGLGGAAAGGADAGYGVAGALGATALGGAIGAGLGSLAGDDNNPQPGPAPKPRPHVTNPVSHKQHGNPEIKQWQELLNANGAHIKVDGIYGPETQAAYDKVFPKFQKEQTMAESIRSLQNRLDLIASD